MKRYISLFCVALIIVTCMVNPASASDYEGVGYVDLMSYGYFTLNGNETASFAFYSAGPSTGSFSFPFNYTFSLGEYEFLIYSTVSNLVFTNYRGDNAEIIPSPLGSNYYVVKGNFYGGTANLNYSISGGNTYFLSAKALPFNYSVAEIPFDFQVFDTNDGELLVDAKNIYRYEYEDDPFYTDIENLYSRQIRIYPNKDFLSGLDYFDLDFYVQNLEIDSISASFGGNALPLSYTTSFIGDGVFNDSISSGDVGQDKTYGIYKVVLRVDISGISLLEGLPTIFITYNSNNYYGSEPYVYVYGINAGVFFEGIDPYIFTIQKYFNKLNSWLTRETLSIQSSLTSLSDNLSLWFTNLRGTIESQFSQTRTWLDIWIKDQTDTLESAIRGDTTPGNSFQDEVDQKDQQLNDMAAVMDSVERPNINTVNVSPQSYVDGTVLAASMSGITSVIGAPVFLDVIMMSLIMATAGYVLFGKR